MDIADHPVLRDHTSDNLTDALQALADQAREYGHEPPDPAVFAPAGTSEQLDQARQWWPDNAPDQLSWSTCLGGSLAMYATPHATTLMAHLQQQAARVTAWLEGEGRDTDRPNESKSERMKRLNRERVAAHRARQKNEEEDDKTKRQAAWEVVVEARRVRARAKAELDADVRAHYIAMTDASDRRREVLAGHDAEVEAAEAAHKALG